VEADVRFLFRGLAVPRDGVLVLPGAGRAFVAVEGQEDALAALDRAALRGLVACESSLEELAAARLASEAARAPPSSLRAAISRDGLLSARRHADQLRVGAPRLRGGWLSARPARPGPPKPFRAAPASSAPVPRQARSTFGPHGPRPPALSAGDADLSGGRGGGRPATVPAPAGQLGLGPGGEAALGPREGEAD
jgi:hypothetical protein